MGVLIQDLPDNPALSGVDQIVVNDVDALDNTTKVTIGGLRDWIRDNISIPTNISDITGLDAALNGKANTVHTHSINQIDGLQGELNTKLDSDDAHIEGQVVTIDGVSVTVPSAVAGGDDARIPNSTTAGNLLRFAGTDGGIEQRSPSQFRSDIGLDSVDNTLDVNKPVSTAQNAAIQASGHDLSLVGNQLRLVDGDGNNIGVANFGDGVTNLSYDQNAENNVITSDTGTDATLLPATDGLAGLMSRQDKTKLDTVEMGADATDTTNVWSSLGVGPTGSTTKILSERGVFVDLPGTGGNPLVTKAVVDSAIGANLPENANLVYGSDGIEGTWSAGGTGGGVAVQSVTPNSQDFARGASTVTFTIAGTATSIVTVSLFSANPSGWITDSALSAASVTLSGAGTGTFTVSIPENTTSDTRTFQVQAQVSGGFQAPVLSPEVRQHSEERLDSITLDVISFGNDSVVEDVTVAGNQGTSFNLSLVDVTPAGWITSGALGAQSGIIGADGTFDTTITIPTAFDDTVNRSFKIRAISTQEMMQVDSATITQVHTQSTPAGNLVANVTALYTTPNIDFYTNVTSGDPPYSLVLNMNPTDNTDTPLHTISNLAVDPETVDLGTITLDADNSFLFNGTRYAWTLQLITGSNPTSTLNIDIDNIGPVSAGDFVDITVGGTTTAVEVNNTFSGSVSLPLTNHPDLQSSVQALVQDSQTFANGSQNYGSAGVSVTRDPRFRYAVPSSVPNGPTDYYVHISDTDGDVVVDMETITIANQAPSGSVAQTMGSATPANNETIEFTATYTDQEGDPFGYQWQTSDGTLDTANTVTLTSTFDTFLFDLDSNGNIRVAGPLAENSLTGFVTINTDGTNTFESIVTSNTSTRINISTVRTAGTDSFITIPSGSSFDFSPRVYTDITGETNAVYSFSFTDGTDEGLYRTIVTATTGDTTPVNSNEIELT